jgi:hypothetical protein
MRDQNARRCLRAWEGRTVAWVMFEHAVWKEEAWRWRQRRRRRRRRRKKKRRRRRRRRRRRGDLSGQGDHSSKEAKGRERGGTETQQRIVTERNLTILTIRNR